MVQVEFVHYFHHSRDVLFSCEMTEGQFEEAEKNVDRYEIFHDLQSGVFSIERKKEGEG